MKEQRELEIGGKRVIFSVRTSSQAMAVPHDFSRAKLPLDRPFLCARVGSENKPEWVGILLQFDRLASQSILDFSDDELRRLYAQKAPHA